MNKQIAIIAASLLCLFCALGPLRAQIVTNGSFESPDIPDASFNLPSGTLGGWTWAGNTGFNDPLSGYGSPEAPDGQQFALLQTSGAFLTNFFQTITLPSTGIFTLSFFDAGRSGGTGLGDVTYDVFLDATIIFTDATNDGQLFELETVPFAGTAGSHILKFQINAATTGDRTAFFDAIGIVPEPSTCLLAAVGAVSLVFAQRRRGTSTG